VNPYETYLTKRLPDVVAAIREMVECESPSDEPQAVNRFVDLLSDKTRDIAKATTVAGPGFGNHLRLQFQIPGKQDGTAPILGLGHADTVWPMGTIRDMPFREADGRLWGPGVLDMKAGLAFFLFAVRGLIELDLPVRRPISLLVVSDEEVGSPSSRPLTENEARQSRCVLVLEPGAGLEGKLKTARKGIADYQIVVKGRASHAGVDFEDGASAIVEVAHQIPIVTGLTDLRRGTTVNPGVIHGGTRSNVVASEARLEVDVRAKTLEDWKAVDERIRRLQPSDTRCQIEVTGGLNRPPMVRSDSIAELFQSARAIASGMGVALEESETGGGSDGNFTAGIGIPTLDGLGAVGEGAHARNESILVSRITDRISLLIGLLTEL
jgi:glutamate carboxypeptidase